MKKTWQQQTTGEQLRIGILTFLCLGFCVHAFSWSARGQSFPTASKRQKDPKLSSILRELRDQLPQETEVRSRQVNGNPNAPFARQTMPRSIADAVQNRTMRIDPSGKVQVYIELDDVTSDHLNVLRALGCSLEIISEPKQ